MRDIKIGLFLILLFSFYTSCAPVKFSKSDNTVIQAACSDPISCNAGVEAIQCNPKINETLSTFTYASLTSGFPSIASNCQPADVAYTWTVKKADSTVINVPVTGLSGGSPTNVDFPALGQGAYYVFLSASKTGSGLADYQASTPLEFVVPGSDTGNSLTCDPKLNGSLVSVTVNQSDANPSVAANCTPAAGTYLWTATKDGAAYTVAGLSGANSTPNFKSMGAGTYRLSLYATSSGSAHWQSSTPLTVVVNGTPPATPNVACNPRINGSLTNLTLNSASANPLISGNCLPSSVQYTWSVTKNGNTVNVPGLAGANSNPNFLSLGTGTYLIYLNASAPSHNPWTSTQPLTITVDESTTPALSLNCAPRLNNIAVAVSITTAGPNPLVTSGCNPSSVTHNWSVFKAGQPVTIAGLGGSSSTGNFTAKGVGTYYIYLTASAPGYNSYVSPSPLEVNVGPVVLPYRTVVYEKLVQTTDNKVDILMIVDDSNSMAPENTKLAERLQGFVNDLGNSGIDWQMCATVTRAQDSFNNGTYYWGASTKWINYVGTYQWVLVAGAADPYAIFTDTIAAIGAGWAGTDDERAIRAAWQHIDYAEYNHCYRPDASIAMIAISDEDERSIGGNPAYEFYQGEMKYLEFEDQPEALANKIRQEFGNSKRFTFNSIIVKPGDSSCLAAQDAGGAKSHYGFKYRDLSQLTGGGIASICSSNYSSNLNYFKDRIVNTLASIPLECAPVGPIAVSVTPSMGSFATSIVNNSLVFNPAIPAGRTVRLEYKCPMN